jgi:hypothetical protein
VLAGGGVTVIDAGSIANESLRLLIQLSKGIMLAFSPYRWELPENYERKFSALDVQSRILVVIGIATGGDEFRLEIATRYFDSTGMMWRVGVEQIIPKKELTLCLDDFSARWIAPAVAGIANELRKVEA